VRGLDDETITTVGPSVMAIRATRVPLICLVSLAVVSCVISDI
jgi:hypothetical protein